MPSPARCKLAGMGSALRLASEDSAEVGYVPHPFDHALRDGSFRRTLPRDELGAFLRSAVNAEREGLPLAPGHTVLEGLRRAEAFERSDRARRHADARTPVSQSDLAFLRTARRPRVHEARVRTAFPGHGGAWDHRIAGPITAEDAWRDLPEGESRQWVHAILGPVDVRADGSIVRPGHACRETQYRSFEGRFEKQEQPIEIHFVEPHEHPDWRALLAFLEAHPSARFRFTSW